MDDGTQAARRSVHRRLLRCCAGEGRSARRLFRPCAFFTGLPRPVVCSWVLHRACVPVQDLRALGVEGFSVVRRGEQRWRLQVPPIEQQQAQAQPQVQPQAQAQQQRWQRQQQAPEAMGLVSQALRLVQAQPEGTVRLPAE